MRGEEIGWPRGGVARHESLLGLVGGEPPRRRRRRWRYRWGSAIPVGQPLSQKQQRNAAAWRRVLVPSALHGARLAVHVPDRTHCHDNVSRRLLFEFHCPFPSVHTRSMPRADIPLPPARRRSVLSVFPCGVADRCCPPCSACVSASSSSSDAKSVSAP